MTVELILEFDEVFVMDQVFRLAPSIFSEELVEAANEIEPIVLEPLQREPHRPPYPIDWDSDRQKRAFFATRGFGLGIPTERTGELPQSWSARISSIPGGIDVLVKSSAEYAPYVRGRAHQSRIFRDLYQTVEDVFERTRNQVDRRFKDVVRRSWVRMFAEHRGSSSSH